MRKYKVLVYSDFSEDCSGFGKIIKDLLPVFLEKGHDVRQVALRYNGLYKDEKKEKIKIYPTQIKGVKYYWAPEVLEYAIADFEPDIVFSLQDYFVLPYLMPVLSKPYKKEFKHIHYGMMDGEPMMEDLSYATSWAHYNIFMADYTKRVVEKALPNAKGEVIYPATDPKTFKPIGEKERTALRKKLGLDNTYNILFIGRNQFRKNLPALFEAIPKIVKKIPNARLIHHSTFTLTPQGQPAGYDLGTIAKNLGVEKYIAHVKSTQTDVLKPELINKLYNISDVFVLPCFSEDTTIMSDNGFKTYNELNIGDEVITLNPQSGLLEKDKVINKWIKKYDGNMVHFKNTKIDMLVTPNHRIYYSTPKQRKVLKNKLASWFLDKKSRYYIPITGKWQGIDDKYIDLKTKISQKQFHPNSSNFNWKAKTIDFMELLGWFISEGCITNYGRDEVIVISNYNNQNLKRIAKLLKTFNLKPYNEQGKGIRVYSKQLCTILKQCGKYAVNKTIPKWVLKYDRKHLKVLFDALINGDGSDKGNHLTYYTSSASLKDRFIELCYKLGYSTKVHNRQPIDRYIEGRFVSKKNTKINYAIGVSKKFNSGSIKLNKQMLEKHYSGKIWCIETKNKTVIAHRNGTTYVSGNSCGEGFGLPLTEAMACGVPTIGTNCSAVTEVIGNRGLLADIAGHIYVDGKVKHAIVSVDSIVKDVLKMHDDKKFRDQCIERGFKFTQTLTPEKVGNRILKVFDKVIKEDMVPLAITDPTIQEKGAIGGLVHQG